MLNILTFNAYNILCLPKLQDFIIAYLISNNKVALT